MSSPATQPGINYHSIFKELGYKFPFELRVLKTSFSIPENFVVSQRGDLLRGTPTDTNDPAGVWMNQGIGGDNNTIDLHIRLVDAAGRHVQVPKAWLHRHVNRLGINNVLQQRDGKLLDQLRHPDSQATRFKGIHGTAIIRNGQELPRAINDSELAKITATTQSDGSAQPDVGSKNHAEAKDWTEELYIPYFAALRYSKVGKLGDTDVDLVNLSIPRDRHGRRVGRNGVLATNNNQLLSVSPLTGECKASFRVLQTSVAHKRNKFVIQVWPDIDLIGQHHLFAGNSTVFLRREAFLKSRLETSLKLSKAAGIVDIAQENKFVFKYMQTEQLRRSSEPISVMSKINKKKLSFIEEQVDTYLKSAADWLRTSFSESRCTTISKPTTVAMASTNKNITSSAVSTSISSTVAVSNSSTASPVSSDHNNNSKGNSNHNTSRTASATNGDITQAENKSEFCSLEPADIQRLFKQCEEIKTALNDISHRRKRERTFQEPQWKKSCNKHHRSLSSSTIPIKSNFGGGTGSIQPISRSSSSGPPTSSGYVGKRIQTQTTRSSKVSQSGCMSKNKSKMPVGFVRSNAAGFQSNKATLPATFASNKSTLFNRAVKNNNNLPAGFTKSKSALPTGFMKSKSALPTGFMKSKSALPTGFTNSKSALPTGFTNSKSALPTGFTNSKSALSTGFAKTMSTSVVANKSSAPTASARHNSGTKFTTNNAPRLGSIAEKDISQATNIEIGRAFNFSSRKQFEQNRSIATNNGNVNSSNTKDGSLQQGCGKVASYNRDTSSVQLTNTRKQQVTKTSQPNPKGNATIAICKKATKDEHVAYSNMTTTAPSKKNVLHDIPMKNSDGSSTVQATKFDQRQVEGEPKRKPIKAPSTNHKQDDVLNSDHAQKRLEQNDSEFRIPPQISIGKSFGCDVAVEDLYEQFAWEDAAMRGWQEEKIPETKGEDDLYESLRSAFVDDLWDINIIRCNLSPVGMFLTLDVSKEGWLNEAEVADALKVLGVPNHEEFARNTLNACDRNRDGKVSKDEFVHYIEHRECQLQQLFNRIDVSGQGYITLEALRRARDSGNSSILHAVSDLHLRTLIRWMATVVGKISQNSDPQSSMLDSSSLGNVGSTPHKGSLWCNDTNNAPNDTIKVDFEGFKTALVLVPPSTGLKDLAHILHKQHKPHIGSCVEAMVEQSNPKRVAQQQAAH